MINKKIVVIILFISTAVIAQKNNTSAYSFFGIGDKNNSKSVEQLSMGGIGTALSDSYHLNLLNPASNASLLFTTYTIALENRNIWVENNNGKEQGSVTYLSYLAMGMPIGTKGGLVFGLLPNTTVGYSLSSNVFDDDENLTEFTLFNGEGGSNKVFLSYGYRPFKGLSIGVQGNYIFGKIENNILNQVINTSYATKYESVSNISGFAMNAGVQYKGIINEKLNFYVGGNIDFQNEIKSKEKEYTYKVSLTNTIAPRDSIVNKNNNGILKSPMKSSVGIGFGNTNKWYAGADYSFQEALDLTGSIYGNRPNVKYGDYSNVALGGFYIPKFNSITSYWERVTYRAGVKYEKSGLLIDISGNGNNFESINAFGISFGIGLPVAQQLSSLNLGLELGKRGKKTDLLVQENYINFRLSLSLTDKWFQKREIF